MTATLLGRDSSGTDVRKVHSKRNARAATFLPRFAVDDIFGPRTQARVREFQSLSGLQVDGIIDPNTRATLERGASSFSTTGIR
jgi:peptidoglycan hydrolase-like protein with peptidoglycan-binding domain